MFDCLDGGGDSSINALQGRAVLKCLLPNLLQLIVEIHRSSTQRLEEIGKQASLQDCTCCSNTSSSPRRQGGQTSRILRLHWIEDGAWRGVGGDQD